MLVSNPGCDPPAAGIGPVILRSVQAAKPNAVTVALSHAPCRAIERVLASGMRWTILIFVIASLVSSTVDGQEDSTSQTRGGGYGLRAWIVPIGVAASTAVDAEVREWALRGHSASLDHLAHSVNPLGTAHVLIPAITVFYAGSLIARQASAQHMALATAAAYTVSDALEATLKPVIGRERPHAGGNSHRFRAFTRKGDWHSFPSAHVAHITAIAEAISMQTASRPVATVAAAVVTAVAWDRVYEDQHWTSDVTATAALTAAVSRITVRWVTSHWSGE